MIKRALLNIGGFAAYIGAPLLYVGLNYDFFITKSAGITVSSFALVGIIACLPVLRYFFAKSPIKANYMGIVMIAFGYFGMMLGSFLFWVGVWTLGGSVVGDLSFKAAEKLKVKEKDDKQAALIAEKLKKEM